MPKFLEDKLKREYPNNPHAVFGAMNKVGAMHGNKETTKGKAMEKKHAAKEKGDLREMRIQVHRDKGGKVTGHTVHHEYERPKQKSSSPAFYEERPSASHPFGADEHDAMVDHIDEHLSGAE